MATYKKRESTGILDASINLSYGSKSLVKTLRRNFTEVHEEKKTLGTTAVINLFTFNPSSSFTGGTFKDGKYVLLCNEGDASAEIQVKVSKWTTTAGSHASGGTSSQIIKFVLHPNDHFMLPNIKMLNSEQTGSTSSGDNDSLINATPDANLYLDSGINLDGNFEDSETTLQVADIAPFEVGDLIQIGINTTTATRIEIMEVTAITDDSGTDQNGTGILTVRRALFGTSKADKDSQTDGTNGAVSGANVHFPFINEYYDHDRALSGSSQLVQTDNRGRWKSRNFFG